MLCVQGWFLTRKSSQPKITIGSAWHVSPWSVMIKSWRRFSSLTRTCVWSTCHHQRRGPPTGTRLVCFYFFFHKLSILKLFFYYQGSDSMHGYLQVTRLQESKIQCFPSMRRTDLCFWRRFVVYKSFLAVWNLSRRLKAWGPVRPCRPWCAQSSPTSRGSSETMTSWMKSTQSWFTTT